MVKSSPRFPKIKEMKEVNGSRCEKGCQTDRKFSLHTVNYLPYVRRRGNLDAGKHIVSGAYTREGVTKAGIKIVYGLDNSIK